MDAGKVLCKSTEDSLNSLGKSTKQTLVWQLSRNGFEMAPDSFDINRFFVLGEKKAKRIWQEENR